MVIDKDLVNSKLKQLEDLIFRATAMNFSFEELSSEVDIQDVLLFRLQQAVETAIDIANHLVSGLALPHQDKARDVFSLLTKHGVISADLAKKMGSACGFRNLIVHMYGEIDFSSVFRDYKNDLQDLRDFAKEINKYVTNN